MTLVLISPRARRQVQAIATWWAENRGGAPDMFAKELAKALERIAADPLVGPAYHRMLDKPDVRCLLLRRSRYRVYYRIEARRNRVRVLAVWHMARGIEPRLG